LISSQNVHAGLVLKEEDSVDESHHDYDDDPTVQWLAVKNVENYRNQSIAITVEEVDQNE
jgi:hypothetical protein